MISWLAPVMGLVLLERRRSLKHLVVGFAIVREVSAGVSLMQTV